MEQHEPNLPLDFVDLLAAFASAEVRYLIIGGYAVGYHDRPRTTKDLDILLDKVLALTSPPISRRRSRTKSCGWAIRPSESIFSKTPPAWTSPQRGGVGLPASGTACPSS